MSRGRISTGTENAFFTAICILGGAVIKGSASESELLSKFKEARDDAQADGQYETAATIGQFIRLLFEPPRHYVPE